MPVCLEPLIPGSFSRLIIILLCFILPVGLDCIASFRDGHSVVRFDLFEAASNVY
ncbi:hypothetical protein BDW62DRAFT_175770 [Aspergillus aurantiobrunneus]